MSKIIRALAIFVVAGFIPNSAADDRQAPVLSNNPFTRPSSTPAARRDVAELDEPTQAFDLRATIVTTKSKLANVAGRTLRPGDEVQGYILKEVFEDRAVFSGYGKHLVVYVKPDLEKEEDEQTRGN